MYRLLADIVVLLHLSFVLFVLAGALLALRWPRMTWAHLPAVAWAAYVEFSGRICPLTPLENRFRQLAGESGYAGGFVEHYLLPLLYPTGLTPQLQIWLGVFVCMLNIVLYAAIWWRYRTSPPGHARHL